MFSMLSGELSFGSLVLQDRDSDPIKRVRSDFVEKKHETWRLRDHSPDNFFTFENMISNLLHRDARMKSRKGQEYRNFRPPTMRNAN